MGFEINWSAKGGDNVLNSPQYQKWSQFTVGGIAEAPNQNLIKTDLKNALASRESAEVINYLSWLVRLGNLVG